MSGKISTARRDALAAENSGERPDFAGCAYEADWDVGFRGEVECKGLGDAKVALSWIFGGMCVTLG